MREKAIVLKRLHTNLYQVQLHQDPAHCLGCGSKDSCCRGNSLITIQSDRELIPGQQVQILIQEKDEFLRVFFVFLLPLILAISGTIFSYQFFFPKQTLISVGFFFLLLLGSFWIFHFWEKKSLRYLPVFIDFVDEE